MTKTNEMTFTPEALKAVLDQAVAEAVAAALGKAAKVPANTLVDGKTDQQLRTEVAVCRAFKKAGYGEVKPRDDVRTYGKWAEAGFKVKTGERATKVKQFRLFHRSQCEWIGLPSKAEQQAEADAPVAAHAAAATAAKPSLVQRLKGKGSAQTSLPV